MPWSPSSLRAKLLSGAALPLIGLVLLCALQIITSLRQRETRQWVDHTQGVLRLAASIRHELDLLRLEGLGLRASGDRRFEADLSTTWTRIDQHLQDLREQLADNAQQQRLLGEIRAAIDAWVTRERERSRVAEWTGPTARSRFYQDLELASPREAEALLNRFTRTEQDLLERRLRQNDRAALAGQVAVPILCGALIVVMILFLLWISRSIVTPIRSLTEATGRIRAGDLSARVPVEGRDELGRLAGAFNGMTSDLQANGRELDKRDVQAGVLQVAEVLATSADVAHLLDATLDRLLSVARCPAGAIYVRTPDDDTLRCLVASGTGLGVIDAVIRPGEGIVGRVAQGRAPQYLAGASDQAPLVISHWIGEQRPAELAYVPLRSGPESVGLLALAGAEPFDDRTRNVLRIVAGQIGAALQNALSLQVLQRQAVELEARNSRLDQQRGEIERQNRELRVASQLKSEFLANMSHELRTPLTIILGFTNTVLRGAQGALNAEQADSLRRVHDNARQLLALINDILDLSKIEAGQMELDPQEVIPGDLLAGVVDGFRQLAGGRGLGLRLDLAPDLPGAVVTDETRLRQVVANLVSNALKFTERGEVAVVGRRQGTDRFEIEVRDTGPGIAAEDIPKIFEQFRQLDGRTTRRVGGTGLGLSIVKRLVEMLGGTLDVRSRPGQGSSFVVGLPIRLDTAAHPDVTPRPAADGVAPGDGATAAPAGRLVLAIDDDEDFLTLLRAAFRDTPFSLRAAATGREGLELAESLRPDAITLDVMMPDMDGWQVLAELKSKATTAEIPVILLTVLQRRGLGLMLGAADYLTKPLDRERLIRALRKVAGPEAAGPILVIDDDPDIRAMLDLELRAEGFTEIRTAADGAEGLRLVRDERPALVILDLMMPNVDGFEVAARLQEDEQTQGIPILVLTAKDLNAGDLARLRGQIEAVVQKGSLSVDALIARLVGILRALGVEPAATPSG